MKNISKTSQFLWGILITVLWIATQTVWAQEFPHVTPEELKKMIESRDPGILIVDVQPKVAYDLGHIQGAVNFPWEKDLKSNGNLPRDKTLILYCDCGQEEDSTDVATQLRDKWGYANIKLLEGSWSMWRQLGYPVEKKEVRGIGK